MAKLAGALKGKVNVVAMDMANADEIIISRVNKFRYAINGYPTIIGFYNGKPYSIYQGDRSYGDLMAYIENIGTKK
jgi:thioredoxin-like negative regulator of GroEL